MSIIRSRDQFLKIEMLERKSSLSTFFLCSIWYTCAEQSLLLSIKQAVLFLLATAVVSLHRGLCSTASTPKWLFFNKFSGYEAGLNIYTSPSITKKILLLSSPQLKITSPFWYSWVTIDRVKLEMVCRSKVLKKGNLCLRDILQKNYWTALRSLCLIFMI